MIIKPRKDSDVHPFAYQPDPMGRVGFGRRTPTPQPDSFGRVKPDPSFERIRERSVLGASLSELFGADAFRLSGTVGEDGENHRDDVAKLEAALSLAGNYETVSTGGPTGYYGPPLADALRTFQAENGLAVDGSVEPDGETIRTLERKLTREVRNPPPSSTSGPSRSSEDEDQKRAAQQAPKVGWLMPAPSLTREAKAEFARVSGLDVREDEDGKFNLTDRKSGSVIARLSPDLAASFVQNWESIGWRLAVLTLLYRSDLTDQEKIDRADRMLPMPNDRDFHGAAIHFKPAREKQRRRNRELRALGKEGRAAFRKAVRDMANGASRQDVLPELQKALFPELYGGGPLREFALDAMPGIGNIRSVGHAANDIFEISEALASGDGSAAARHFGMLALDLLGIVPGGNVLKSSVRAAIKATPYGEAMAAKAQFFRMARQFSNLRHPVNPKRLFGASFDSLSPSAKRRIRSATNNLVGAAAERRVFELAQKIDKYAKSQIRVSLPQRGNRASKQRRYDYAMRDLKDVVLDDLLESYAKLTGRAHQRAQPIHYEHKAGAGEKSREQKVFDEAVSRDPATALQAGIKEVRDTRMLFHQIPLSYLVPDAERRFNRMIADGRLRRKTADSLMQALRQESLREDRKVRLVDYADLMVRLGASSIRTGEKLMLETNGREPISVPVQ